LQLTRLARAGKLRQHEHWFYPLWAEALLPYTLSGYTQSFQPLGFTATPSLTIGLQTVVKGGGVKRVPDLTLIETFNAPHRRPNYAIRLFMEVKKGYKPWLLADAKGQVRDALHIASLDPVPNGLGTMNTDVVLVACSGDIYAWTLIPAIEISSNIYQPVWSEQLKISDVPFTEQFIL
jgi:hypothetical protein